MKCKHHELDYGRGRERCQFCGKFYKFEMNCKYCVLDVDNKCIAKCKCVLQKVEVEDEMSKL